EEDALVAAAADRAGAAGVGVGEVTAGGEGLGLLGRGRAACRRFETARADEVLRRAVLRREQRQLEAVGEIVLVRPRVRQQRDPDLAHVRGTRDAVGGLGGALPARPDDRVDAA